MNRSEYLLSCLAEEASEVIKAVCKAQRFGLKSDFFGTMEVDNEQQIQDEFAQMLAVMEMLEEEVFGPRDFDRLMRIQNGKKLKVLEFMEHSIAAGCLERE